MRCTRSLLLAFVSWLSAGVCCSEDAILRIGVSVPLTGPCAEYGAAVVNGLILGREDGPDSASKLRFITDDNQYTGRASLNALMKHKDIDKVDLVFVWGDLPSLAIAPVAERSKVPTIAVLTDPIGVRDYKYVIRFLSSHFQYTEAIADYLNREGVRRIGLIHSQSPYDTNHSRSLAAALHPEQHLSVLGSVLPSEMDFRSLILKAKGESLDILGVYIYPTQYQAFFRQAHDLQLRLPVFGADGFESKTMIAESNGGMEGALYASHEVAASFLERYMQRFGNDTHITYAANAYDFTQMILEVLKKLDKQKITPGHLLETIRGLPPQEGVLGRYSFKSTVRDGPHFDFPVVVKKVSGGNAKVVGRYETTP